MKAIPHLTTATRWGTPPWNIDFRPRAYSLPAKVDFAVVGGGFTGLAAAAWLRRLNAEKSVALFEAECLGSGSSGHTGGMTLSQSAAGDLPGLGDVLSGLSTTLRDLRIDCDLTLPGAWELARTGPLSHSPIHWNDSGDLRVCAELPGGTADPGKLVDGLARAADEAGVMIFERSRVEDLSFLPAQSDGHVMLNLERGDIRAAKALIATNAQSLELGDLTGRAQPKFTLALATESLRLTQLAELGLADGKPFYTADLPYLWGRLLPNNGVVFGSGLIHLEEWSGLTKIDVSAGTAAQLLSDLERRVRGLHPVLRDVGITNRWGGPILIADRWQPVFAQHSRNSRVTVLGAYAGHGVALSVYLGRWAAEAMLERKALPSW